MAKSQQTFNKLEREKNKAKKREAKRKHQNIPRCRATEHTSGMLVYLDASKVNFEIQK